MLRKKIKICREFQAEIGGLCAVMSGSGDLQEDHSRGRVEGRSEKMETEATSLASGCATGLGRATLGHIAVSWTVDDCSILEQRIGEGKK